MPARIDPVHFDPESAAKIAPLVLEWYDRHHRTLPWRIPPKAIAAGERPDPYHVWLSEIMLQQTGVATVAPYFLKFVARWPDVAALAAADSEDVMKAWAGLGYYSRARNLKKCAEAVAARPDGSFPATEAGLKALPGIGDYTAAAIGAIAFNLKAAVVDGNVERVVARLCAIGMPAGQAKREIRAIVAEMTPESRPGDFAQAMMDLGATLCTPRRPACVLCPVQAHCAALAAGTVDMFPVKPERAARPRRVGAAFVAIRKDGAVLLRKRPDNGLLGGMSEVPTTGWTARRDGETGAAAAPIAGSWRHAGAIRHVFTHFELELQVFRADVEATIAPAGHWWSPARTIGGEALPTVMAKAIEAAMKDQGRVR